MDSNPRGPPNWEVCFKNLKITPATANTTATTTIASTTTSAGAWGKSVVESDRVGGPERKPTHYNVDANNSSDWRHKLTHIKIVEVLAPNKYIISPLKYLDNDRVKAIEDNLELEWAKMGSLVGEHGKNPEVGEDVFAIFKNPVNCSKAYKRGYVLKKKGFLTDLIYDVFLYDYCETERIPVYRLKILPNAFKELPPRFLYLTLPGICPTPDKKLRDQKQIQLRKEFKRPSFQKLKIKIKDIIKSYKSSGAYFEFCYKSKNADKLNLYGDIFFVQDDKVEPQSLIQLLCEKEKLEFSYELWKEQLLDEELDIILAEDIEPVEATRKHYYGYFPFETTRPSCV